jgi:hypothetical protein
MKEYLIDSGGFNIIVVPERRQYVILDDEHSAHIERRFVGGESIDYDAFPQRWFNYTSDAWTSFDGSEKSMSTDVPESKLIEYFVLKKHNFGALVAVRDTATGKVQVFKRERIAALV